MASTTDNNSLLNTNNLQVPHNLQVVIVYTEWNEKIVNELVAGAMRIVSRFPQVTVKKVQVPGCVEITNAIFRLNEETKKQAFIAFGCVIKGETPHFDYVCQSVTQGITHLNATQRSPVIFGILTVNNEQQALDRIGGKHGHKGEEAAIAALKMASIH